MDMKQMLIDAYMKPLYDQNPTGELLERAKGLEQHLAEFASKNPQSMDLVGDSGMRDVYNQLYMDVLNPQNHVAKEPVQAAHQVQLPSVHEFLNTYRHVYESSIKGQNRPLTDQAYEELFSVANRTDDLVEAQIIIEKEHLVLNTVTADYKAYAMEFMEAVDPNYEVTSAAVNETFGVYQTATSLEEIAYMGELARAKCDDIAVQTKVKVEMIQTLQALLFAWEHAKGKIRQGENMEQHGKSMVFTRRKVKEYYQFLAEDMGITFDVIEKTPFYRILMLNPKGLDSLWRVKKVMHPENIKAMRYALLEEILSEKSLEDILLTPQPFAFYEEIDTNRHPEVELEFQRTAEELNQGISYFQKYDGNNVPSDGECLLNHAQGVRTKIAESLCGGVAVLNGFGHAVKKTAKPVTKVDVEMVNPQVVGDVVKTAAKGLGKGLLKGLFRG